MALLYVLLTVLVVSAATASAGTDKAAKFKKNAKVADKQHYDVDSGVDSKVDLEGNVAVAESAASAHGDESFTSTFTGTTTTDYSSLSYSSAVGASGRRLKSLYPEGTYIFTRAQAYGRRKNGPDTEFECPQALRAVTPGWFSRPGDC